MRKIKAKKLSKEAFAPFGAYYSMTEPEGKALCGELHAFTLTGLSQGQIMHWDFHRYVLKNRSAI